MIKRTEEIIKNCIEFYNSKTSNDKVDTELVISDLGQLINKIVDNKRIYHSVRVHDWYVDHETDIDNKADFNEYMETARNEYSAVSVSIDYEVNYFTGGIHLFTIDIYMDYTDEDDGLLQIDLLPGDYESDSVVLLNTYDGDTSIDVEEKELECNDFFMDVFAERLNFIDGIKNILENTYDYLFDVVEW